MGMEAWVGMGLGLDGHGVRCGWSWGVGEDEGLGEYEDLGGCRCNSSLV